MQKKIIIGVNTDPQYYCQLPLIQKAYRTFFPEFSLIICVISDYDSVLFSKLRIYCDELHFYSPIDGVLSSNLSKVVRYFHASNCLSDICVMNDIDIIPLIRKYFIVRFNRRKKGSLLTIGSEYYNNGKFPTPFCTAEGYIFKKFINPLNFSWVNWVHWIKECGVIDKKENITNPFKNFSDESLIRVLLKDSDCNIMSIKKYPKKLIYKYAVSRHHPLDIQRLFTNGYIEGHHLIPLQKYKDKIMNITKFLKLNFNLEWWK